MPQEPLIKGLSKRRRTWFFRSLLLIFVCTLPVVILYTTGYRLDIFNNETPTVVTTGGIYIDTENTDVQVYLNEEQFVRPRLFQSAYYLQNISAGNHRVVVQAAGVHTWVKELPVYSHIVTEAAAFNVPLVTQLRPITEYQTATGTVVYFAVDEETVLRAATTTEPMVFATSTATSSLVLNPEYEFVAQLFASSTATTSVFADNARGTDEFRFMTESELPATTTATTTPRIISRSDIELVDRGVELYAVWRGQPNNIPYYFCVSSTTVASTSERYGEHVADAIFEPSIATSASSTVYSLNDRTCRSEIKLDRLQQDVYLYDFFPGVSNLVLLHLQTGLYVTEIDDRAWQNTQSLLLGDDFLVLIENDLIYIKRGEYLFELLPEIDSN